MKTFLFKPFEKYSEKSLFLLGSIFTLIGSFVAHTFNTRFDGVFDIHITANSLFYQTLVDNIINIFCLLFFLYLSAICINKKTRLIDILTTAMIARIPLYLVSLMNSNAIISKATEDIIQLTNAKLLHQIPSSSLFVITVYGIITILFLIWYVSLLLNGFKVASNAKGKVSVILFSISLLFAEILSKFLIFQLN
jgi:hypothetical protein